MELNLDFRKSIATSARFRIALLPIISFILDDAADHASEPTDQTALDVVMSMSPHASSSRSNLHGVMIRSPALWRPLRFHIKVYPHTAFPADSGPGHAGIGHGPSRVAYSACQTTRTCANRFSTGIIWTWPVPRQTLLQSRSNRKWSTCNAMKHFSIICDPRFEDKVHQWRLHIDALS